MKKMSPKRSRRLCMLALALFAAAANLPAQNFGPPEDYSKSNSVTIFFGWEEEAHGLHHVVYKDGPTLVETYEGVPARVSRLGGHRTALYFYFSIDENFKQTDLARARFEVEYLALEKGTMGVNYDGLDGDKPAGAKYRESSIPIKLVPSTTWKKATF